ncbi:MAG TPA: LLM class flavin-dependent oxidoreductase, partial [Myxococcaceae bacterium]|nr:LLM class flavin-dependent oxidoreductase [Myxococcaceae bacterium]
PRPVPFSVLDLAPICEGGDAAQTLRNSLDLARHAERLGYERYWLAEHHNMQGIASSATSVVIAHVAAGTSRIRVGSGGIMLPNHAPLVIAEQFGTLATLFPGRIDLGLGRAPGTDPRTAYALRRNLSGDSDQFPQDVVELLSYLGKPRPGQRVHAVPGEGTEVPVWILGSSLFGASLAAAMGLPFAFASHFAPVQLMEAIALYRSKFEPSQWLAAPRVMVGSTVVVAPTDEEARFHFSSLQQAFLNLRSNRPGRLPPPRKGFDETLGSLERELLGEALSCAFVGAPETVRRGLEGFLARTQADELIVSGQIHDHAARVRSYALLAEVRGQLAGRASA